MKISIVIITNHSRPEISSLCIDSTNFANEIIIVGNTKNISQNVIKIEAKDLADAGNLSAMRNLGESRATGDIVIFADDDIFFPPNFHKKLLKYINNNPNFGSCVTKVIGINGGRYWDWCSNTKGISTLLEYNTTSKNQYYSGAFLITQKWFSEKYKWDESLKFYEGEDVQFSKMIAKDNQMFNIDINNYVGHLDFRYITTTDAKGELTIEKGKDSYNTVFEKKEAKELQRMVKILMTRLRKTHFKNDNTDSIQTREK